MAAERFGATFGEAFDKGFTSWGRVILTRFLCALAPARFLLPSFPGVYCSWRFSLAEPVSVLERGLRPSSDAPELRADRGRFWLIFRLASAHWALVLAIMVLLVPTALIHGLDHWLVDAASRSCAMLFSPSERSFSQRIFELHRRADPGRRSLVD